MEGRPASEEPAAAEADAVAEDAAAAEDEDRRARPATDPTEPDVRADDSLDVDSEPDELVSARMQRDEYLELAQRAKADFENYRKRTERDAVEAERRGRAGLVRELVPVLDNLERALLTAGIDVQSAEAAGSDGDALAQGVLLVYRDLRSTVERAGVEAFDPVGERFDPEWHEALSTRPGDGTSSGTVVETVEKGYRLDDQLLRAARVIVSE
jgi:molecular chaperone GrpE